jgi:hypothetical protein
MLVELIVFLAICLLVIYMTIQFMGGKSQYLGPAATYDLSIPNQKVLEAKDLPWSDQPATLRFAIYVAQSPRTIAKVDCIDSTSSFAPSCDTYSFNKCVCTGSDCAPCKTPEDGYLSSLVRLGDTLEFLASGYTSQTDKPYVPALLKVRTAKDSTQHAMESIPLPAIPLQKWTVVTIVKEGRRFDVYYGAKLVNSKLTDYVPVPADPSRNWFAGNAKWKGKIGFFSGDQKTASSHDVFADVQGLVNTRGIPYFIEQNMDLKSFFTVDLPSCALGNCNQPPSNTKLNPFTVYASSVS